MRCLTAHSSLNLYICVCKIARDILGLGNGVSESLLKLEEDAKKEHSVKVNKPHTKSIAHNHFQGNHGKENYRGYYCHQPGLLAFLNQQSVTGDQMRNSGQTLLGPWWSGWAENRQQAPFLLTGWGGVGGACFLYRVQAEGVRGLAGGLAQVLCPPLWRCSVQGARSVPCCCSHTLLYSWLFRSGGGLVFLFFFLVFLQLLSSLLQLSIQLFLVSPIQFLCSSLLEERFVPVQAPRQSKPGPGLSHYFFDKQNQLKLKSSPPKEKMRGSFWALKGQFPRIQVDVFKLTNDQILLSPASEKHPVDSLQNLKVARLGKLAKLAWSWIAQRINSQTSVHGARAGTQHCWVPWKPTGSFMGREWEALKDNTICVPPYRNTNFPYGGTISFST